MASPRGTGKPETSSCYKRPEMLRARFGSSAEASEEKTSKGTIRTLAWKLSMLESTIQSKYVNPDWTTLAQSKIGSHIPEPAKLLLHELGIVGNDQLTTGIFDKALDSCIKSTFLVIFQYIHMRAGQNVSPISNYNKVEKYNNTNQQDAQEFLQDFLDVLFPDTCLKRIKSTTCKKVLPRM